MAGIRNQPAHRVEPLLDRVESRRQLVQDLAVERGATLLAGHGLAPGGGVDLDPGLALALGDRPADTVEVPAGGGLLVKRVVRPVAPLFEPDSGAGGARLVAVRRSGRFGRFGFFSSLVGGVAASKRLAFRPDRRIHLSHR